MSLAAGNRSHPLGEEGNFGVNTWISGRSASVAPRCDSHLNARAPHEEWTSGIPLARIRSTCYHLSHFSFHWFTRYLMALYPIRGIICLHSYLNGVWFYLEDNQHKSWTAWCHQHRNWWRTLRPKRSVRSLYVEGLSPIHRSFSIKHFNCKFIVILKFLNEITVELPHPMTVLSVPAGMEVPDSTNGMDATCSFNWNGADTLMMAISFSYVGDVYCGWMTNTLTERTCSNSPGDDWL